MEIVQDVRHTLRLIPKRVIPKQSLTGILVVSWEDNETELFLEILWPTAESEGEMLWMRTHVRKSQFSGFRSLI
jgi:hypothetical protein